jgi:amino-acid N-acetyltransferase
MVGFAAIEIYSRKMAEIQSLAVSPALQGQGVGTKLVQRCVDRAQAEGILELMAITASEKLFRGVGFDYSLPNQKRALFMQTRDVDQES